MANIGIFHQDTEKSAAFGIPLENKEIQGMMGALIVLEAKIHLLSRCNFNFIAKITSHWLADAGQGI